MESRVSQIQSLNLRHPSTPEGSNHKAFSKNLILIDSMNQILGEYTKILLMIKTLGDSPQSN